MTRTTREVLLRLGFSWCVEKTILEIISILYPVEGRSRLVKGKNLFGFHEHSDNMNNDELV